MIPLPPYTTVAIVSITHPFVKKHLVTPYTASEYDTHPMGFLQHRKWFLFGHHVVTHDTGIIRIISTHLWRNNAELAAAALLTPGQRIFDALTRHFI